MMKLAYHNIITFNSAFNTFVFTLRIILHDKNITDYYYLEDMLYTSSDM